MFRSDSTADGNVVRRFPPEGGGPSGYPPAYAQPRRLSCCERTAKRAIDIVGALDLLRPLRPALPRRRAWRAGQHGPSGALLAEPPRRTAASAFASTSFARWCATRTQVLDEFLSRNDMARTEWDTFQKLEKDPRITPIGQFIRKLSLDELPQFWNVLKGDMSLVGPRPCMERQRSLYGKDWAHYCAVRPGITGLWQVSGRNRLPYAQPRRTRRRIRRQLVALARHQDPAEDRPRRRHRRRLAMTAVQPVVLCGGSGTRLWPLSRKTLPKQFAPLIGDKSLLQLTLERLRLLQRRQSPASRPKSIASWCRKRIEAAQVERPADAGAGGAQHRRGDGRGGAAGRRRTTCCCSRRPTTTSRTRDRFAAHRAQGVAAALAGYIVTFGVVPTFPEHGLRLHPPGRSARRRRATAQATRWRASSRSPTRARAEQLLLQGGHLWNAGIFLVQAQVLIAALRGACARHPARPARRATAATAARRRLPAHGPRGLRALPQPEHRLRRAREMRPASPCIPFEGAWSDVGSWNAVADLHAADADGNRMQRPGLRASSARNTFIHAPHRPVVALGTDDLLIVDTPDALLVAHARLRRAGQGRGRAC